MKYKLIREPSDKYNAIQQVLINRGIEEKNLYHYLHLQDDDINSPDCFGHELLMGAEGDLFTTIKNESDICIIVDCDCDGYTSAALLINYLYDLNNEYTKNHVHWFMHEGKQHGLKDAMDWIEDIGPELVIIPDAGSNDWEELDKLHNDDRKIIILDHHEIEGEPYPNCWLINSQLPQYPNKELSGVGVVYQFCRFIDQNNYTAYADSYLDLVALGNIGDMMSLQSFETRKLIDLGLIPDNIQNPFIYGMWQKNMFKLTETPTAWGFTFYIVPFVNAITRSGTQEEKELIFKSMLKFEAFNEILSNKRGHKVGEKERLLDQALRTCTNVKNRQTKAEDAGITLVTHLIEDNNMMDHKVLLFLLEPGDIKPEIRGLVANKIMARYQRPCCMLTKTVLISAPCINPTTLEPEPEVKKISYQGSARGCDKVGVTEFKDICAGTQVCDYTVGHQGAFGLSLPANKIETFINKTDEQLKDMPNEPIYRVDYIWDSNEVDGEKILEIADMAKYWGKDMDESLVAIKRIQITKEMLTMMKSNTAKITLPNGISIIKFRMPDEEYNELYSENGYVEIDAICKCNCNNWMGNVSPQLLLEDYEIIGKCAYIF